MNIRKATIHDAFILAEVENMCFPPLEAATLQSLQQRLTYFANHFYLLFEDNILVSFIDGMCTQHENLMDEMYENAQMHEENGDWFMIFGVNTIPTYRNKGYASILMQTVILEAKQQKRKGIVLTCKRHMLSFYEKFGFVNEGMSSSVHGDVTWYQMRYIF